MSPETTEIKDGCLYFRPEGAMNLEAFIEMLRRALAACHANKTQKLLVDTSRITGGPFTVTQRYFLVVEATKFWDNRVKLAFVNPPGVVPPDDFAKTAATNRGIRIAIFSSEAVALEWLKADD